jgi:tetratricopeptide (TPR) repeat protein
MLIRCRKCQALYTLQDGVAASGAAFRVECGRCLEVFEAAGPRAAGAQSQGVRPVKAAPRAEASAALERKAATAELARPPAPEDDLAARLGAASRKRRRLLMSFAGVAVLGLAVAGALRLRSQLGSSRLVRERLEASRAALLLDDGNSLQQAANLASEAARLAPGDARPEAERAFALLLIAAAHKDLAERLEAQARKVSEAAAKLSADKPAGFETALAALTLEAAQLGEGREPHLREATRMLQQGVAAAKAALDDDPEDPAALRAMALYCALSDAGERGARYLQQAEKIAPDDAFVTYTRAALALAGAPSREKQDRALAALAVVRQAEPRLLRAVYDTAAVALERGELGPARNGFEQVLKANPVHERAKRMLSLIPSAL